MTNVEALKELYVALGGNAEDVANITLTAEMISAIATVAASVAESATTPELPEVAAADNGKVLTVVDGKWTAQTLPE